jgi:3-oxoacyl-[acyl-carrier-protein] synthase-1
LADKDTVFILATTKGNIELLEDNKDSKALQDKLSLFNTANLIAKHFNASNQPLVVSNACISGVAAVILAKRLLESNRYKHAVITGADVISRFVVSGFQCLYAMSDEPCKPFDENRNGITLGECAVTMVLTTNAPTKNNPLIKVNGGALTNDANHISGPSRTGAELSHAINTAIKHSGITSKEISFTSTHGTATVYNDEMEAKALSLSGCLEIPLHSLKGNYGHTLGAAGVLESILTYQSLQQGVILPSKNFNKLGVSEKIVVNTTLAKSNKQHALKTASGFGGCNAALIYSII